ncbi:MAG: hypothetical protein LC098_04255 [Burkholderiales bacterium]|nr:hypothetical protein [Burkholderiales bacterium]
MLATHCEPDLYARFSALAASQDKTRSALLHEIVQHVVSANAADVAAAVSSDDVAPSPPEGPRRGRIELRLPAQELSAAKQLALADGRTLQQWLRAVVRKVTRSAVPFNPTELDELRNVVLAAGPIGRNLNTVAKFYRQTGRVEPDSVAIETLTKQYGNLRAEVATLIDRASSRYEVGDD